MSAATKLMAQLVDAYGSGSARRRLAIRVTKDAERQLRGGHPWVFDRSITSITPETGARSGDLAVVFDSKRRFLAIGLYDPASPIRVKVLHHGTPSTIDPAWWRDRLAAAAERRSSLDADPDVNAYRLVHGENDGMPGLVIDRYDHTMVLKLYSSAWFAHLPEIVDVIVELFAPATVVLRLSRLVGRDVDRPAGLDDGVVLVGEQPHGPIPFVENGLLMEADVVSGQKTGYFLDQRDNRLRVRALAAGRRVLDVYCCTGGFTVHAAAGGATEVHSVDISGHAIAATERAMRRNVDAASQGCRHTTTVGDAMEEMARLRSSGRRFDLVVVDPPSFASRTEQRAGALRAYSRLTALGVGLCEPGGTVVMASCSSRISSDEHAAAVLEAAASAGSPLVDIERTGHAIDHPIGFPEGAYLNAVFATVSRRVAGPRGRSGLRR